MTTTLRSTQTNARIAPNFRCVCGRVLHAYDLDIDDDRARLTCWRCHRVLIEIETDNEI
jgi:hypothetical protein